MKTSMASPSSGYQYDSWYVQYKNGPYAGGYYVTLSDWGSATINYSTNNPHYTWTEWSGGVRDLEFVGATCPSWYCLSSGLWPWGAYVITNVNRNATTGYTSGTGH